MELPGKASEVDVPLQKIGYKAEALAQKKEKQHYNEVKFNFNCQQSCTLVSSSNHVPVHTLILPINFNFKSGQSRWKQMVNSLKKIWVLLGFGLFVF